MKSTRPFFTTSVCLIAFLFSGEVDARLYLPPQDEPIDVDIKPEPGTPCNYCIQMMCPCALCPDGINTEGCCGGGCVIQDDGTCGPEPPTKCPVIEPPPPPPPPLCYQGQNECGTVGGGQCAGLDGPCNLCSPYSKETWGYGCDEKCYCNDNGTCSNFKPQSMCPVVTPPCKGYEICGTVGNGDCHPSRAPCHQCSLGTDMYGGGCDDKCYCNAGVCMNYKPRETCSSCIEGEVFGEAGKDCPALRCACQECPNSKKVWGCCGKCYCIRDGSHSGFIPEDICNQGPYDYARLDASP